MTSDAHPPDVSRNPQRGFSLCWPVMLVFAVVLLTSHSRAAEVPFSLLACAAPFLWWRHQRSFWDRPAAHLLLALFACYWLPMLAALPDALDPTKSALQTLAALRFPLAGLTILMLLRQRSQLLWLYRCIAVLTVAWAADALVQHAVGFNVLGMPDQYPRLSGVFGNDYLRLGLYSGLLLPFLLHQFDATATRHPLALGLYGLGVLLVLVVIWFSGTRSGWIVAALALSVWAVHWLRHSRPRWLTRWRLGGLALLLLAVGALSYFYVPSVQQRVGQTAQILSGDPQAMNQALSYRLPIWRHAWDIARDHPWNGVGPRGFRHAYSARAEQGDYFISNEGKGASHAHQLQLAIATETGVIGLAGFVVGSLLLWRSWRRIPAQRLCLLAPPALTLLLAVFPLNSHLDAYASSPALLFWWGVAVYLAAYQQALSALPRKE